MAPRPRAAPRVTNLERFYKQRYDTANDLLETDPEAAQRSLLALLSEHRLPIWMRVQCNGLLGYIADTVEEAEHYLADAQNVLQLFKESCSASDPDLPAMEEALEDVAREIERRRENPWEEEELEGGEDHERAEEEAEGSDVEGAEDEELMLLGHVGDPDENTLVPLTGGMEEMLLGDVDYAESPIRRTPSPYSTDVDSMYVSETVFSPSSQRLSSASPVTVRAESPATSATPRAKSSDEDEVR